MTVTSRRLLSLSGIALGPFFLIHLTINARALRGDAAFANAVDKIHRVPGLALCEWLLIFAPLLLHATVGLWLILTRGYIAEPSPYPKGVRAAVRVTGLAAVAFIAVHLSELRFRSSVGRLQGGELATLLAAGLSSTWHGVPIRGAAYLAATACVAFHFAAGTWAFVATTRAGKERQARKWAAWGAGTLGAVMWAMLANIVVFHATGSRLFDMPGREGNVGARLPCPSDGASAP
jgi:succinate dehydrogenase / fumarate reductase cytochrome b subunit